MSNLIPSGDYRDFYPLSEQSPVPYAPKRPKKPKKCPFLSRLRRFLAAKRNRTAPHKTVPMLAGALCGTLSVTVICLAIPLTTLIAPYRQSYRVVTVPTFEGYAPEEVPTEDDSFNLILRYEINPNVPDGVVIAQSPAPGVRRTIRQKGDRLTVTLTVSRSPESHTLSDLSGLCRRDAELALANQSLTVRIEPEYASAAADTVLGTIPPAGTVLEDGQEVTLRISLGQKPLRAYVPDLCGLGESEALSALSKSGLPVGTVGYRTDSQPAGTVIEQDHAPYSMVDAETPICFWVSLGDRYEARVLPDLYGLSREQAIETLRTYGLTAGEWHTIQNGAPAGTVITQSPLPGTPIGAGLISVDLYVSSG